AELTAVDGALRNLVKDPADVEKIVTGLFEGDFKANVAKFVDRMLVKETPPAVKERVRKAMEKADPHVATSAMRNMFDAKNWNDDKIDVPLALILAKSPFWTADYEKYVLTLHHNAVLRRMEGVVQ